MWTTVALMSALSLAPAQGRLELKNARFTQGIRGPERKDPTFLPHDMAVLSFDIDGLKVQPDGQVRYSIGMKLADKAGKAKLTQDPQEMVAGLTVGGNRLPAFSVARIGSDTPAGEYTMQIEVKDIAANSTAKLEKTFTVKAMQFGIVRAGLVYIPDEGDADANVTFAPPLAVPGQNLRLHFAAVDCKLDGNNRANVQVSVEVQDDSGKAVLDKPITGKATDIDAVAQKEKFIPFQIPLMLNRAGKYKVVITVEDKNANKTAKQELGLRVVELE